MSFTREMNTSRTIFIKIISLPALLLVLVSIATLTRAQAKPNIGPKPQEISAEKGSSDDHAPLTTFEEEIKAKRLIKMAEKEHQENLNRAKELSQISQDLKANLKDRSTLDREDAKRVERLEKLTKKIRGEAGGEDDDVQISNAPNDIPSIVTQIADNADLLSKDVQKTPRQVVSTSVIDRANVLLQLVKMLRGFIR